MKKILILANNAGGLYKFRKELLETLLDQNNAVYVSIPDSSCGELLQRIGCICLPTPIDRRGTNLLTDLKLMLFYNRLLRDIKPDMVLTYTIKPNIYGGLACQLNNIPYIANITGLGSAINKGGMFERAILLLLKTSLRQAGCVFFQNKMNQQHLLEKKIVTVRNRLIPGSGVNLADHRLENYPEGAKTSFLFMGRIMKEKGIDEYLQAAQALTDRYPFVDFQIVGECEEAYQERLQRLQELDVVKFYGYQDDVHNFIKACHAVILPSYHEGMSNVLLEAAACGRPVIASDIPGCRETFEEGISGYGFEPRNPIALIEKVEKFIRLPYEAKEKMGLAGRAKVEREFDRQSVIDSYLFEIDKMLQITE